MHSVIIGNGIIGMTIAYRLLKEGRSSDKITIIGMKNRPGSASLAAGAMLNSFAEIEAGGMDHEIDILKFELSHQATQMWPSFERELIDSSGTTLPTGCLGCQGYGLEGSCAQEGTFVINNTVADDLDDENFDAILNALIEFNESHSIISPKDIPGYKPAQRSRANRAILIHNEGWYNPRLFIEKLENILSNAPNVKLIDEAVCKLTANSDAVLSVSTKDEAIFEGDTFILANGASLSDLLDSSGLGLQVQKVFYGVGVSLELSAAEGHIQPNCIRTPNRGLACGVYSVPYFWGQHKSERNILIGASNFISPVPLKYGHVSSVESLLKSAMNQIHEDFYKAGLVRVNVGFRPVSTDTYPLIGKSEFSNLYIVSGTKRDGFHLSPLISKLIVDEIFNGAPDPRFKPFNPTRTPIRSLTRESAITKAIRHRVSADFQHEYNPSRGRMSRTLIEAYRSEIESLHDQVGAYDWGIPPELLEMYRYGHVKSQN